MSAPRNDLPALVIIPTYDERESLPITIAKLFAVVPTAHVLVVDDASPDGTGQLADELAAADERISVLHRTVKDGLGRAYLAGFAWGLENGYSVLVEMDADGSHPASSLPEMLAVLSTAPGLVIGSRWVDGGSVVDWPASRRWLSRSANAYARIALGIPVRDMTAGYRAYTGAALAPIVAGHDVDSRGYCFQIDMTIRTYDAGWSIREVPITFRDRELGSSKMSAAIVIEAMAKLTAWAIGRRIRPRSHRRVVNGDGV